MNAYHGNLNSYLNTAIKINGDINEIRIRSGLYPGYCPQGSLAGLLLDNASKEYWPHPAYEIRRPCLDNHGGGGGGKLVCI